MKQPMVALAALSIPATAGALAQPSQQIIMPPATQPQIAAPPVVAQAGPALRLPPGVTLPNCLLNPPPAAAIVGEKGSEAVIGEKGSEAIVGEKGSEAVIGEKGSEAIVGEKSSQAALPMELGDRWNAAQFSTFKHVLVGPPGTVKLNLYGCSSASGGETVSIYLADSMGNRKTGWRHFVIATRNGNHSEGKLTLPKAAPGQTLSQVPIVVIVENASGRPNVGEYRLTVTP